MSKVFKVSAAYKALVTTIVAKLKDQNVGYNNLANNVQSIRDEGILWTYAFITSYSKYRCAYDPDGTKYLEEVIGKDRDLRVEGSTQAFYNDGVDVWLKLYDSDSLPIVEGISNLDDRRVILSAQVLGVCLNQVIRRHPNGWNQTLRRGRFFPSGCYGIDFIDIVDDGISINLRRRRYYIRVTDEVTSSGCCVSTVDIQEVQLIERGESNLNHYISSFGRVEERDIAEGHDLGDNECR